MLTFGSTVPLKHYSVLRPLILQYQIIWSVCTRAFLIRLIQRTEWVVTTLRSTVPSVNNCPPSSLVYQLPHWTILDHHCRNQPGSTIPPQFSFPKWHYSGEEDCCRIAVCWWSGGTANWYIMTSQH